MAEPLILIVEDDEELQTLYGLYLQGESYQIQKAFNGKEALDFLLSKVPAVIVLDMIMPEMDGEAFLQEFYKHNKYHNIPVIIASVNDKIPEKILKMTCIKDVLKKPFSIETLVSKVRQLTKK